ncbi:MAG TPA: hypothetical protein VF145_03215 [Chitinophagaceae bacterium]
MKQTTAQKPSPGGEEQLKEKSAHYNWLALLIILVAYLVFGFLL